MAKSKTNKEEVTPKKIKTVDQLTIARLISNKTGLSISEITEVIELEQKFTMNFVKRGRKVIKKNYLTLTPIIVKARKLRCPINNKEYNLEPRRGIAVRVGRGFKAYVSDNKKMPSKICRFVDGEDNKDTDSLE